MSGDVRRVSSLIGRGTFLRFKCPGCSIPGAYYQGTKLYGRMETLTPRAVIARFGDVHLSELSSLRCNSCGSELDYVGYVDRDDLMRGGQFRDYAEEVFTQYLIKFVILAASALGLIAMSTFMPRQLALILIPSVLISATLVVIFLAFFNYWGRFRLAVVLFEQNIRSVTLVFLFACLILAMLAFAAVRLS